MPSSVVEPRLLRILGRRAEARLAWACELAARARREANAASDELDSARRELVRLDEQSARAREALRRRIADGAPSNGLMNRDDFARREYAHRQLMGRRSNACVVFDTAKRRHDAALAALVEACNTQRKLLLQREKYRLAERLSAGTGSDDAVSLSLLPLSSLPPTPMPVLR